MSADAPPPDLNPARTDAAASVADGMERLQSLVHTITNGNPNVSGGGDQTATEGTATSAASDHVTNPATPPNATDPIRFGMEAGLAEAAIEPGGDANSQATQTNALGLLHAVNHDNLLGEQLDELTRELSAKFEELTLIHHLTQTLDIHDDPRVGCQMMVNRIASCVAADWVLCRLNADDVTGQPVIDAWSQRDESNDQTHFATDAAPTDAAPTSAASTSAASPGAFPTDTSASAFVVPNDADDLIRRAERYARTYRNVDGGTADDGPGRTPVIYNPKGDCDLHLGNRFDLFDDEESCVDANTQSRDQRYLIVPMHRGEANLGMIVLGRRSDRDEFDSTDAELVRSATAIFSVHVLNQRQYFLMEHMLEGMIQSLVSALDAKDAYTCGHSTRVASVAVELAKRLGFDDEGVKRIRLGGLLHDVGKIGVEDSVLRKPGRLTDEEFEQIKQHPVLGYEILKGIRQFQSILPAVRHHHESIDGSGYPDGLAGDEIPRDAQVMAVADAFDAMTSDRPYRRGMPLEKVVGIFENGRGQQWAADVVDVLLADRQALDEFYEKGRLTDG